MYEELKEISIWGRIAYGICCLENFITAQDYSKVEWAVVFELLWSFSDEEYYDEWLFKVAEFLPENILENEAFDEGEWDFIDEDLFYVLRELYSETPFIDEINLILLAIHNICCAELYTLTKVPATKSLIMTEQLIEQLKKLKFELPNIALFTPFSIHYKDCWGIAMKRSEIKIPYGFGNLE